MTAVATRTLQNSELIVEVTSESTQASDHSDELAAYTGLDSLREYWTIDPEKPLLTQYTHDDEGGAGSVSHRIVGYGRE